MFNLKRVSGQILSWFFETKFRVSDLLVLIPYGTIVGFGIWHHEPWSDEALPWMIARDSDLSGFFEFIFHNWDRHPGLFHSLLVPFVKLGFPYFTQALLNAFFALAAAFLFLAKSPFPRIFRYLFLFSYYMIYEYSVIARPYMLAIVLLFSLADFYPKRGKHPILYGALIAIIFHADYMTFGLAAGMTLAFFLEYKGMFRQKPKLIAAFVLMVMGGSLAAWMAHALPPGHGEYGEKAAVHLSSGIKSLANAFFPFASLGRNPGFTFPAAILAGSLALIMAFVSLIRKPLFAMVLGVSLSYLFTVFIFFHGGDFRNYGFILLSVIFVLWIEKASCENPSQLAEKEKASCPWAARMALGCLGVCFLLGFQNLVFVYVLEYQYPFSGAQDMAKVIANLEQEKHIFEKGFVVVAPHKNSVGLLPYLPGVKFWNPCSGDYPDYYRSTQAMKRCNQLPEVAALEITRRSFGDLSRVLFLFRKPLPFYQDGEYEYQKVFAVPQVFGHWQETFFLYRALPKVSGNTKQGQT